MEKLNKLGIGFFIVVGLSEPIVFAGEVLDEGYERGQMRKMLEKTRKLSVQQKINRERLMHKIELEKSRNESRVGTNSEPKQIEAEHQDGVKWNF